MDGDIKDSLEYYFQIKTVIYIFFFQRSITSKDGSDHVEQHSKFSVALGDKKQFR